MGIGKQYCKNSHDTFVTGRYSAGNCKVCAASRDRGTHDAEYYQSNSARLKAYATARRAANPNYITLYIRNRKHADPLFKLSSVLRTRLASALKVKSWHKTSFLKDYIGCSQEELKTHIENQFTEGMTWNNHSPKGWHIDHIVPLASAETIEELYKLCHYSNLQPLWALKNLAKGSRLTPS